MIHSRFFSSLTLFLSCSFLTVQGQQTISPELIKQAEKSLQSKDPQTKSKMTGLIEEYRKKNQISAESDQAIKDNQKAKKDDSEDKEKEDSKQDKEKSKLNKSVYEMILQGKVIDPNAQLESLHPFGYEIFTQEQPSTFTPADFSVPVDYPINVGDEIVVLLWGRLNEEYRLKVSREGTVNIPHYGPITVAGLTFDAMQRNILDRVGKTEGVQATVSMGELRSIGVYIVGEVQSPGYYSISTLSNVTNALFAAGGPNSRGSLRNIQLKRGGRLIATVDFYDFLLNGVDKSGLRLQSGDVIVVPIVKSMAAIVGNVRRNGLYELKGSTNLKELINLAGGFTPAAWTNKIQVERFTENQYQVVLDLDSTNGALPNFEIKDADIVKIFPVLVKDKNAIYLSGNVLRPGKYEFHDGMKVRDLVGDYNDLLSESYFDYAVIYRKEPPSFLDRVIPFNLKKAIDTPESEDNLALKSQDQVMVFHKDFFEPDRSVGIDGAITTPGKYKLMENMKIRDLVLVAGGLKEEASSVRGELYRRTVNNERVNVEKTDFCIDCAMRNEESDNLTLQRGDQVYIRSKVGWESDRKVTLKGQFMYPGTYVLFEGETLGDLIKRAGGFKPDAYLSAAVFTRKSIRGVEEQRIAEYSKNLETDILKLSAEMAAKGKSEESEALLAQQMALKEKLTNTTATGRIVIDLTKEDKYSKFGLEDGDELNVPRNVQTVSVIGEVFNPSTFQYNPSQKDAGHYIEIAGGLKENADKKHVYIIKANGSILTRKSGKITAAELMPGDAVVVPQKLRYTSGHKLFIDTMDAIFKFTTVAALVVSAVAK